MTSNATACHTTSETQHAGKAAVTSANSLVGLTSGEARQRLAQGGPNAVADVAQHPVRRAINKLWAPVPWMLEAAILLQLGLGDYVQASVVALLLLFNAGLGYFRRLAPRRRWTR